MLQELVRVTRAFGLSPRTLNHEWGPTQYELTFGPVEGVAVGDDNFTYKTYAKEIAFRHGLLATFMTKPFSPKELVARVRSLFRRMERKPASDGPLLFRELEVDRTRHTVRWAARPVRLTAKEFALLVALLEANGRVLSRSALLEEVWGYSYAEGTRTVDVHIRRLREKIPELAPSILTVKSMGYRIADEAS